MKKRLAFLPFLIILFVNLVNAAGIEDILYNMGGISTVIYLTLFLGFFLIIFKSLSRFFRESLTIPIILSLLISFVATYGLSTLEFDMENWVYSLGIPPDLLWVIIAAVLLLVLLMVSRSKKDRKFRFYRAFMLLGLGMAAISSTELVYEQEMTATIGIIIFLLAIWRRHKVMKKMKYSDLPSPPPSNINSHNTTTHHHYGDQQQKPSKQKIPPKPPEPKKQNFRRIKKLRRRERQLRKILNTMPMGKNVAKGTRGYRKFIKLQREFTAVKKELYS